MSTHKNTTHTGLKSQNSNQVITQDKWNQWALKPFTLAGVRSCRPRHECSVFQASLIFFDAVFDAVTSVPMRGSHVEPPRVRSGLFLEHSSPLTDPSPEACLSAGSMVSWADGTETSGARLHGWAACTVRSAQASRRRVPAELDLATSVAAEVGDHHQQVIDGHSGTRQRHRRVGT